MTTDEMAIRPPLQARTRASWERVLNAGARVLEEDGYEGFTIAAVRERAGVSVATIYARAANKDALFLAVYEHVLGNIGREELVLEDFDRWDALPVAEMVRGAVAAVADRFLGHADFLKSVILLSGVHQEIRRRGAEYSRGLGERFTALLMRRASEFPREDVGLAADACFRMVFSSLAIHVSYGAGFESGRAISDEQFVRELQELAVRYLLSLDPS